MKINFKQLQNCHQFNWIRQVPNLSRNRSVLVRLTDDMRKFEKVVNETKRSLVLVPKVYRNNPYSDLSELIKEECSSDLLLPDIEAVLCDENPIMDIISDGRYEQIDRSIELESLQICDYSERDMFDATN